MDTTDKSSSSRADIKEALLNLLNSSVTGGSQYVTFRIEDEDFAIEIEKIQEITAFRELNKIPNVDKSVAGIFNLRGTVIPIMDPRIIFNFDAKEYTKESVIVIFKSGEKTIGMIVDEVRDVLTIDQSSIDDTPDLSSDLSSEFIDGIGKVGDKFIMILNTEKVFPRDSTGLV